MNQKISLIFLYIFTILISFCCSLNTNVHRNDIKFEVNVEYGFLEKKEKIDMEWESVKDVEGLTINDKTVYKIELLTNHALSRKDDSLLCEHKDFLNKTTVPAYKWKIPKLKKRSYYGILVNIEGTNIYGLSRKLDYIPNLNKFLTTNNSTDDVSNFINKAHNKVVFFYEDEVEKVADVEEDDETSQTTNKTSNNSNNNQNESSFPTKYVIIIILVLVIIAVILSIVAFNFYRKNKKTTENVREILVAQKEKEALQNFDLRSESAESEVVREKLKQDALEKERQKVFESMKEKNLLMVEGNLFPSNASDAVSNAVSNTNTDFSWHGMEVMSFNTQKPNGNSKLSTSLTMTPLAAPKKIDYDAIAIEVDDEIHHQEELAKNQESEPKVVEIEVEKPEEPKKPEIVSNPNSTVKFKL